MAPSKLHSTRRNATWGSIVAEATETTFLFFTECEVSLCMAVFSPC